MSNYLSYCTQKQFDFLNGLPSEKTGALGVHVVKNGIVVPVDPHNDGTLPLEGGVFSRVDGTGGGGNRALF